MRNRRRRPPPDPFLARKLNLGTRSATWVSKVTVPVAQININEAAHLLRKVLAVDPKTESLVGGNSWWTLRGRELTGEWIEVHLFEVVTLWRRC